MAVVFFLFRRWFAPSADRCETSPHDRKLLKFYNLRSKIRRSFPKDVGAKNVKILGDFERLQTSIANRSGIIIRLVFHPITRMQWFI